MDHTQHPVTRPGGWSGADEPAVDEPAMNQDEPETRLAELAAIDAAEAPEPAERLAADLSAELDRSDAGGSAGHG